MSLRAGVVGFRGYSGAELVAILGRHPGAAPVLLEHREDGAAGFRKMRRAATDSAVFLHSGCGPGSRARCRVSGYSSGSFHGAFALAAGGRDPRDRPQRRVPAPYSRALQNLVQGAEHTQPALLAEAAYGRLLEFCRDRIPGARLISNPGCYPTAANLAIRPLIEAGVIDRSAGIVCDAKSGVSGAGRKPSLKTSFCEVTENFSAYSILDHRHVPEVLLTSGIEESEFSFTAQLLPLDRRHSWKPSISGRARRQERRRPHSNLREPLCQGAVHPAVRGRACARSPGCPANQLLRHRGAVRCGYRAGRGGQRDR